MVNFTAIYMKHIFRKHFGLAVLIAGLFFMAMMNEGCKKKSTLNSGGEVRFSTDTLAFDTVFTAAGSFTMSLRIFNPQDEKIVLSSVRLEQGNNSFFKLNVDGFAGNDIKNIEIAANDSAYVFATVKIDPTAANSPFFIEDKLIATLNGNDFSIPVQAYGQNANYIVDSVLKTQIWSDTIPYVIIHSALVDRGQTLTIPKGCKVFMHADSRLLVDGTLITHGTKDDSVVFQGDRLDRAYFGYEGYPGEWGGIYFTSFAKDNELNYTIIKNGGNTAFGTLPAAIQVNRDSSGSVTRQLYMNGVTIENSLGYGLLSFGGNIRMENSLIHTTGAQALALVEGGHYELDNCTIVNYGSDKVSHVEYPAAILLNYFKNGNTLTSWPMNDTLRNCVIYGSLQNEFVADSIDAAPCAITLKACVLKAEEGKIPTWVARDASVKFSIDPLFTDAAKWNFRPKTGSPLIDNGINLLSVTPRIINGNDLDNKTRTGTWDIGAYEAN